LCFNFAFVGSLYKQKIELIVALPW